MQVIHLTIVSSTFHTDWSPAKIQWADHPSQRLMTILSQFIPLTAV